MASDLPTILYAKSEIDGIAVRPDSRAVMRKAVSGHPVEVLSGNDYINLYHVFERMQGADKKLRNLVMVRKQVGNSRWLIFVTQGRDSAPEVDLLPGYDPKRGRYKRFAEQLKDGETLLFKNKAEAVKARRAWQLYVPAEIRRHVRSSIRKLKAGFVVEIIARKKR